jgi:hypothetical protein
MSTTMVASEAKAISQVVSSIQDILACRSKEPPKPIALRTRREIFRSDLHGLGRSSMSKRVFVCVSGGVVDEVVVPPETNGTWTVIDWDNIESDPAREWGRFDEEDRAYVKANYPDDYGKHFAAFESK